MTQITITISDRQLQAALAETSNRLTDLTPVMTSIGEYMLERTSERFDGSTAPNGQRWAHLAQATIDAKRRRQNGGISRTGRSRARTNANPNDILKDTFLLGDTIAYQPTVSSVRIGTPQKYGLHHQFGAPRRNITPRPFLGYNDEDIQEIEAIVTDYLRG